MFKKGDLVEVDGIINEYGFMVSCRGYGTVVDNAPTPFGVLYRVELENLPRPDKSVSMFYEEELELQ